MTLIEEVRRARHLPSPETARLIRLSARVSQQRMAAELGVDRVTLSRWESGASRPRDAKRAKWADLLDALQRELSA